MCFHFKNSIITKNCNDQYTYAALKNDKNRKLKNSIIIIEKKTNLQT